MIHSGHWALFSPRKVTFVVSVGSSFYRRHQDHILDAGPVKLEEQTVEDADFPQSPAGVHGRMTPGPSPRQSPRASPDPVPLPQQNPGQAAAVQPIPLVFDENEDDEANQFVEDVQEEQEAPESPPAPVGRGQRIRRAPPVFDAGAHWKTKPKKK